MKKILFLLIFLFVSDACIAYSNGFWCIIHVHSKYSDGKAKPTEIKDQLLNNDIHCVIFTDHYDCFNGYGKNHSRLFGKGDNQNKQGLERLYPHAHSADNPFGNYWQEVQALNEPGKFLAIAATEYPFTKQGQEFFQTDCHIGIIMPNGYQGFKLFSGQSLTDLATWVHNRDGIMIYNHPHECPIGQAWSLDEARNSFDIIEVLHPMRDLYSVINGPISQRDPGTRQDISKPLTASNDFHDAVPPMSLKLYRTWIFADEMTAESLFDALRAGRTFVSARGDRITNLNYLPQTEAYEIDGKVTLDFDLEFVLEKMYMKNLGAYALIFRNGDIIKKLTFPPKDGKLDGNKRIYHVHFEDDPSGGRDEPESFSYQIFADFAASEPGTELTGRFGGVLSSPIVFNIEPKPEEKVIPSASGKKGKFINLDNDHRQGTINLGRLDGVQLGMKVLIIQLNGTIAAEGTVISMTDHTAIIYIDDFLAATAPGMDAMIQ